VGGVLRTPAQFEELIGEEDGDFQKAVDDVDAHKHPEHPEKTRPPSSGM
jgi:hypothetical protein